MFKKSKLFIHKLTYCDLRKQCINLAKQKKLKYIRGKTENSSRRQKTLFSTVKLLSGVEPIKNFPNGFAMTRNLPKNLQSLFQLEVKRFTNRS